MEEKEFKIKFKKLKNKIIKTNNEEDKKAIRKEMFKLLNEVKTYNLKLI